MRGKNCLMGKQINKSRLIILFVLLLITALVSFWAAWAKDEGTLNEHKMVCSFFANIFFLFRFPVLTILGNYLTGSFFFPGLAINCFLYAKLIDYGFHLLKKNEIKKEL